jgi:hypothetical protein
MYAPGEGLRGCAKTFGNQVLSKGVFPFKILDITVESNNEKTFKSEILTELSKGLNKNPLTCTKDDFFNDLKQKPFSETEYKEYRDDAENFETGWDYLKPYNIRDVEVMIKPTQSMKKMWADLGIDMFHCISLLSNANTLKHKMLYDDFDVNADYNIDGLDTSPYFEPTLEWAKEKVESYNEQDERAYKNGKKERKPVNNVSPEEVIEIFQKQKVVTYEKLYSLKILKKH